MFFVDKLWYIRMYFDMRFQMKKMIALGLVLPLFFTINEASANSFIEYPGLGVEDPPKAGLRIKGHLNIKDIVEQHILQESEIEIEGINLRANRLTTEGVRYLINVITSPEHAERFKNLEYINLTANPVDIEVLKACKPLLKRKNFKFLDLCRTSASEAPDFSHELETELKGVSHKIIYIPLRHLNQFKDRKETYKPHKTYHDLNLWE